jgi:hypothetical protein
MIEVRSWAEAFSTVTRTVFSLLEERLATTMRAMSRQTAEMIIIFFRLDLGRGRRAASSPEASVFRRQIIRYFILPHSIS